MNILHAISLSSLTWRVGALFALLLAVLAFHPSTILAQTPPDTPSSVSVTRADGTLTVSGYTVSNATKYHITYTSNGGKSWNAAASPADNYSASSITISGADNDKAYIVGVRAGNAHGWSGWRNSPPAKPFRLPPPAAPSSVTVTRSHGALTASWNAVAGATSYHITYTSNKGTSWSLAVLNHASNSITISGADNSKTYIVAVRARNAHGWSGWRNSPPAGPYLPPAIPSGLRATQGNQRVTLSWDNPSDSSITGYEYQYRAGGSWSAWTDIAGSTRVTTSFDKTGLTNGTEYRFKLRAVNGHGASLPAPRYWPWYVAATPNNEANIPKPPGTQPPAIPASVTATLDNDTLQAGWPADELAISYHVTYSSDGGASWSLAALNHPSNAITITPVASNGTYIVAVRAGNDSGWSGWRNSAPVGPPASPELTVTNVSTTTATLSIANHSGAWYYQANTGPDNTCQGPVSGSSKNLTGLTAGTRYTYTAYSASGCNSANELAAETFSTPVSVSNLNENVAGGLSLYSDFPRLAQAFTTGLNSGGYTLKTVTVNLDSGSSRTLTVTLHNAASNGNDPSGDALVTLASGVYASGEHTFTCTSSNSVCDLGAGTTYVIQLAADDIQGRYAWQAISTTNETKVPDTNGWSIGNRSRFYRASNSTWNDETTGQTAALKVVAVPK